MESQLQKQGKACHFGKGLPHFPLSNGFCQKWNCAKDLKTYLLYILTAIQPNSNGCCHYNQFLELHLHFANQILHFWYILAWLCLPLISKIPGQLSSQDWNEITFSCCQLFTAPPDIFKGLLLYFTELTTLSTVNLQVTEAHPPPPPQALGAAIKDSIQ